MSVSVIETSPWHLLTAKLCAQTGSSQVGPDNAQFKDRKKEATGSEMNPAPSSILETLHTKVFLVTHFSDVNNYTTSKLMFI